MRRSILRVCLVLFVGLAAVPLACARASHGPETCDSVIGVLQESCASSWAARSVGPDRKILPDPPPACQGTTDRRTGATVYPRFECICGDRCIASLCSAMEIARRACDSWTVVLEVDRLHATVTFLEEHGGLSYRYSLATGELVGVSSAGSVVVVDDWPHDAGANSDGAASPEGGAADAMPSDTDLSYDWRAGEQGSDLEPSIRCRVCGNKAYDMPCERHIWDRAIPRPPAGR